MKQSLLESASRMRAGGAAPRGAANAPADEALIKQMQDQIRSKVPEEMLDAFDRTTLAGQKVMYSDETKEMVRTEIERDAPMDQKLAQSALGLVLLLNRESQNSIPPPVLVFAGAWLLLEAADLMLKTGRQVTRQDIRNALDAMNSMLMMKAGMKQDQIVQALSGQAPQGPRPATPPPPPMAQPGGMA